MEIKSDINNIYRVCVTLPDELVDFLLVKRKQKAFDDDMTNATANNMGAGCDSYDEVEEWAEFNDWSMAQRAREAMVAVVAEWCTYIPKE